MLSASDLGGLMAMMPAFATDDAADIHAAATIDVGRLHHGLDRMISDGADVIATTGSFGECHTLMPDEFRTLAHETAAAVKKRVPLFIGVTSVNSREVVQKIKLVDGSGADGILLGVPYYFPSSVENAVRLYGDIGEMFPKLNIMIYHNPALHHVTLPVEAFTQIAKNPAVVAMKDSHRTPQEFVELQKIIAGRMSVFVHQGQYATFAEFGAAGFWSIDAWMGPWPQLALRDAVRRGRQRRRQGHHARYRSAQPAARKPVVARDRGQDRHPHGRLCRSRPAASALRRDPRRGDAADAAAGGALERDLRQVPLDGDRMIEHAVR